MRMFTSGIGFDVHPFQKNRPLILFGVSISHSHGLAGHSDADVACHALIDAILGASSMGDIGAWFPDSDRQYKDADSMLLLKTVWQAVSEKGYQLANADTVIIAQAPRLSSYVTDMKKRIGLKLAMDCADKINIKATTTEHLGFTGRKEGIAALATVSLYKDQKDVQ